MTGAFGIDDFDHPTGTIFYNENSEDEYWQISGDVESWCTAETFRLYKSKDRQFSWQLSVDRNKPWPKTDVLWTDDVEEGYFFGIGTLVFDEKIQGGLYGKAVIAVAMLVESRLPGKAFVFGDIGKADIAEAIRWTANFLDKPLTVPVCYDIEHLYQRLAAAFKSPVDMIKRMYTLTQVSRVGVMSFLKPRIDPAALDQYMISFIADHDSLDNGYVRDKIGEYIYATENTDRLFRIVKESSKVRMDTRVADEPFSLQELVKIITGFGYSVPPENSPSS